MIKNKKIVFTLIVFANFFKIRVSSVAKGYGLHKCLTEDDPFLPEGLLAEGDPC